MNMSVGAEIWFYEKRFCLLIWPYMIWIEKYKIFNWTSAYKQFSLTQFVRFVKNDLKFYIRKIIDQHGLYFIKVK